jgi:hypothetical protein
VATPSLISADALSLVPFAVLLHFQASLLQPDNMAPAPGSEAPTKVGRGRKRGAGAAAATGQATGQALVPTGLSPVKALAGSLKKKGRVFTANRE